MLTANHVFLKIKEISLKYLSNPPLDIESVAMELNADAYTVRKHVASLERMDLVARYKNSDDVVVLTARGRTTNLP